MMHCQVVPRLMMAVSLIAASLLFVFFNLQTRRCASFNGEQNVQRQLGQELTSPL